LFRDVTEERIRPRVFRRLAALAQAIINYLDHGNANPEPYHRTVVPDFILTTVAKAKAAVGRQAR
jgi:hypothetical protein